MIKYYLASISTILSGIVILKKSELRRIINFIMGDFSNLLASTFMTFSISLLSAFLLLSVGALFSWLIFRHRIWERLLNIFICISIIPSVLALIILKDIFAFFPAGKFLNIPVIVTILAMLNLTFLLVFIGLNKQLQEEFHRPYHAMTRQLGNVGVFKSSRRKLLYIIRESFKSVLILTFSASVYLEYRLSGDDLYKGIYSYLFQSWWDSHVTRKLAILLFILIFLMIIMTLYSLFWRIFGQHYSES